jgi:hypothetical protein
MNDSAAANQPPDDFPYSDFWTVVAIAAVAAICGDVIHEAIGHGGACLATGGHPLALSTVHFECEGEGKLVAAGGTLANLIAGLAFWAAARVARHSTRLRYFFWLSMTMNLYAGGGYFLFSGIGNIGDWAAVIEGYQPAVLYRVLLTMLGVITYLGFMWISLREMQPFLGRDRDLRLRRARGLTLVPYFTGGILACIAGALNPVGPILIVISAAASSFGGASGLIWMDEWLKGSLIPMAEFQMPPLKRSNAWLVGAAVLALAFIALLGPGIKFHRR